MTFKGLTCLTAFFHPDFGLLPFRCDMTRGAVDKCELINRVQKRIGLEIENFEDWVTHDPHRKDGAMRSAILVSAISICPYRRMVHGRPAYIVACGPRRQGSKPGSVSAYCSPCRSAAA